MGTNFDYEEKFKSLINYEDFIFIGSFRKNKKTIIKYECKKCGSHIEHEQYSLLAKNNKGYCRICDGRKKVERITNDVIINEVEKHNSKLLGRVNGRYKIKIKCSCGNIDDITFRRDKKMICRECSLKNRSWPDQVKVDDVFDTIIEKGATPLSDKSEYTNVHSILRVKCSCGNIFTTSYKHFSRREELKCRNCFSPKGNEHWKWKDDKENLVKTSIKFKNKIKKSFRYKCCISGSEDLSQLQVHHLNSKSKYPELTNDYHNGVLIHKDLHIEFHLNYDKFTGECDEDMFYEFFLNKTGINFDEYINKNKLGKYYENS